MVIWTIPAKTDLKHIYEYIAYDSKFYAQKVAQDIVNRVDFLGDHPQIGSIIKDMKTESIRQLISYEYRIIYQNIKDNCYILGIIRSKQDLLKNLKIVKTK